MRLKLLLILLFVLALNSSSAAQQASNTPPTIERFVSKYDVNGDGTYIQTLEITQRLNSKSDIERDGQLRLPYSTSLRSVEVLEAYTIKADGKRIPVPPSQIQTRLTPEAEAAPNFSDLMVKVITFPDLKIGSAIAYRIRIIQRKPLFEGQFSMVAFFAPVAIWKDAQVEVNAPLNYPLYTEAIEMKGGRLPDSEGRAHWLWKTAVEKRVEAEVAATGLLDQGPRLVVSSFPDYLALGKAYWEVAKDRSKITPAIKKLADEITQGITDQRAQAKALYEWVNQNIRYIYISFGNSAVEPHHVDTILSNRYGDCKDYTVILQSLLAAKEIESVPVIIRADTSYWLPKVAAVEAFNHVIIYIPSLDVYADATTPGAPFGVLAQAEVGKSAFLAGARTGLISIPEGKPDESQINTQVEMEVQPDGGLRATSATIFKGRTELLFRPIFADMKPGVTSSLLSFILEMRGYQGSGKLISIDNAHKPGDQFQVKVAFDLIDSMKLPGPGKTKVPAGLSLGDLHDLEELIALEQRKSPLLAGAVRMDEEYRLSFPQGINVDTIPQNIDFENAAGSYRSSYRKDGNSLHVKRALIILKDLYSPQEYPAFKELVAKSLNDLKAEVQYSPAKDYQPPKTQSLKRETARIIGSDSPFSDPSLRGAKLSEKQANVLEKHLLEEPEDLSVRVALISYYATKESQAALQSGLKHIKWLVLNHPDLDEDFSSGLYVDEEEEGFEEIKNLWLKQVEKYQSNPRVLRNAATFFLGNDDERAERLLLQGQSLEPENYEWPESLAELYLSDKEKKTTEEQKKAVARALEQYVRAIELAKQQRSYRKDLVRAMMLPKAARTAFDAGDLAKAKAYASELLLEFARDKDGSNYGDAMHYGNIILGRIALKEGNVEKAKVHLLIAGKTPGSPVLNSFGPDMNLAQELLAKGEKEVVIQYFHLCANFWEGERKRLERWEAMVRKGEVPDFGSNGR